mmetsp:Transcript_41848/g.90770  ORF Transcript_41848/g.90770 Transcript_41848/m.90770 type:complete len:260 (+) Transcript_41848:132-911(+)
MCGGRLTTMSTMKKRFPLTTLWYKSAHPQLVLRCSCTACSTVTRGSPLPTTVLHDFHINWSRLRSLRKETWSKRSSLHSAHSTTLLCPAGHTSQKGRVSPLARQRRSFCWLVIKHTLHSLETLQSSSLLVNPMCPSFCLTSRTGTAVLRGTVLCRVGWCSSTVRATRDGSWRLHGSCRTDGNSLTSVVTASVSPASTPSVPSATPLTTRPCSTNLSTSSPRSSPFRASPLSPSPARTFATRPLQHTFALVPAGPVSPNI